MIIIFNLSKGDMNFFFESMKFLFSVIAAYVGIRAVINSSKSAKLSAESVRIASESINLNKEKEQREQSAHLILTSNFDYFPHSSPFYKEEVEHDFSNKEGILKMHVIQKSIKETKLELIKKLESKLYSAGGFDHFLKMFNTGKGAAVNFEYKFVFKNLNDFNGYILETLKENIPDVYQLPEYSLEIEQTNSVYYANFKDTYIQKIIEGETSREFSDKLLSFRYSLKENYSTNYIDFIPSASDITIEIPNEFMMLCKHYEYIRNIKENPFYQSLNRPFVESYINNEPIKPIGEICISYYDESVMRTGKYSSEGKVEMKYEILLKDIETPQESKGIRYYLEVNLRE